MADVAGYKPPDGYLTQAQLQQRLGISKTKVQRMVRDGQLRTFEDPRDQRYKLYLVEDVEALEKPRPIQGEIAAAA